MIHSETGTPAEVKCHSGYTYAQRPVEIRVGGQVYRVAHITAEGRTPEGKWFQAVTGCGQLIKISYSTAKDKWAVSGLEIAYTNCMHK